MKLMPHMIEDEVNPPPRQAPPYRPTNRVARQCDGQSTLRWSMACRFTKLEKKMLHRAAEFAMAGEWPWEESAVGEDETPRERRERKALESARDKLEQ